MTTPDLRPWHLALAAADVDVISLYEDGGWLELRLAAVDGDWWDVSIGPITDDTAPVGVFMDGVLLTYKRPVEHQTAIAMVQTVAHDPRGNVGGPDMPSLSAHIMQLVAPWQG